MRSIPRATFGSVYLARWRASALADSLGVEHPAAQAALGRFYALSGSAVPQRSAVDPASVAWHRQSGAVSGYRNRAERRHQAAVTAWALAQCVERGVVVDEVVIAEALSKAVRYEGETLPLTLEEHAIAVDRSVP